MDVDTVLVTHAHPDHFDPEPFAALCANNADVWLGCEPELAQGLAKPFSPVALAPGTEVTRGPFHIAVTGGTHAVIHADIPCIGNVGFRITAQGRCVYHPGDSLAAPETGVDLLAVPINGPWCAMKETVDFVRACAPAQFTVIHDALLSPTGRALYVRQVDALSGDSCRLVDLATTGQITV